jgi:recombinational DNA repair ATPase RecF
MMRDTLKQLRIEHLRGSVVPFTLPFEKGKQLTVIYGENGAGKSTICDALEFLSKGKVGSLENRGLGRSQKYWQSFGKKATDVAVTLETTSCACRAAINKSGVFATPPEARPNVEVLRRTQILSLIQATPGERYEAIRRYIDVSNIEASEAALKKAIDDINRDRQIAMARLQENRDAVRQFWEAASKPMKSPEEWAKKETSRDISAFDDEIKNINAIQTAFNRLNEYPARLAAAKKEIDVARAQALKAVREEEQGIQAISKDAGEIMAVLQAAKAYLAKHPSPVACPLCESQDKVADLAERVNARMTSFSSLQSAKAKVQSTGQTVKFTEQKIQTIRDNAKQHIASFQECINAHNWPKDVNLPSAPVPQDLSLLAEWLETTAHFPAEWDNAKSVRYDKRQFIQTLSKALQTWNENLQKQMEIDKLLPRMQRALEILQEERRSFTDQILCAIAGEVGRLYELVHPGEGLEKISLELDPKKRASLEICASFCGQLTQPQAYFSDSHLDTLGLCVFLALSAMDQPQNTILALDDVLASVDEPHVERLIEMLYAETLKFRHCLITTHYGPWKHKLRWGWLKNGQCQFVELAKWTNHSGLTVVRAVPEVQRLESLLNEQPPDPQLICSKAGIILEAALNFLTLIYECAVPRKPEDRFTLGDLLPSINKKLREALSAEVLMGKDETGNPIYSKIRLAPILEELTRIAQTRNVFGCHFSAISLALLDSDALRFGQQVLALMKALTDPDAGWPKNDKSGQYWATSGETRRLHPLKRPY